MRYFKNIHEFIKEFDGSVEQISIYERGKSITKTKYSVKIDTWLVAIIKYQGRYKVDVQGYGKNFTDKTFVCESGNWEKIEKHLFKLNIFIQFIRDKKLENLING